MADIKFNPRTYRRNRSKLIIVWEAIELPGGELDVTNDSTGEVFQYEKFVPTHPDRFSDNIEGIVIDQDENDLDAGEELVVRVSIKVVGEIVSKTVRVLPYKSFKEKPQRVILCGWSEQKQQYLPLNVETLNGETYLKVSVKK